PKGGDITVQATILASTQQSATTSLYFDVNVPSTVTSGGFWMPFPSIPVLVPGSNTDARQRGEVSAINFVRDYIIPIADSEVDSGANIEFVLKVGSLYCARTTNSTDPRTIEPWSFKLKDTTQRGGATILNNVINPTLGETTTIVYTVTRPGPVTIQVFTLSGDIVKVLQRGQKTQGSYTVTWDGRNGGGRPVARGMYFIRIVGPGVDEYRKVLVVK
ncbi:MAG: T9SS type A sorting domain-containing protein, partial [Spirochaetaceae bacterium]